MFTVVIKDLGQQQVESFQDLQAVLLSHHGSLVKVFYTGTNTFLSVEMIKRILKKGA